MRLAGFSECPASMGLWCLNLTGFTGNLAADCLPSDPACWLHKLSRTHFRWRQLGKHGLLHPEGTLETTLSVVFWRLTAELGYKRNQTLKWSCSPWSPGGWLVKNPFSLPPPPTTLLLPRHLRANRDLKGPIPKPRGTHLSNALFIQL